MKSSFRLVGIICVILMTQSCEDVLTSEFMIYSNDFESNDLSNISGGQFIDFNKSKVLGNFNNDGFRLTLENIPEHTHVLVSFDLYIHDSWDGNTNELNPPGEDHDAWFMEFDQNEKRKASEKILFETTFSNGECMPARCLDQSYPNSFPFVRNPRAGSVRGTRLRGLCHLSSSRNGTTLYRFERSFRTERGTLTIDFYDKLLQTNSPDPKCDESWSMDNLVIKAQIID